MTFSNDQVFIAAGGNTEQILGAMAGDVEVVVITNHPVYIGGANTVDNTDGLYLDVNQQLQITVESGDELYGHNTGKHNARVGVLIRNDGST